VHRSAEEHIAALQLAPHPEGGWFREIFRSPDAVGPCDGRGERAALSIIYFLLAAGERSRWHGLRSDEQWTYLEGDPLELWSADADFTERRRQELGSPGGERTRVIRAGWWQAARTRGAYTLVACTVGPGFAFEDFSFLADDPEAASCLRERWPEAAAFL
jgi:predicted cupin superfamily sugar epimerase